MWENLIDFKYRKKNQVIPVKNIQLMKIYDCNFLEQKNALFNAGYRDSYINEKIYVNVELKNPLKIDMNITNIQLDCEYESKIDEINLNENEMEIER